MAEKFEKCCKFKIELKGRRRRGQSFSPSTTGRSCLVSDIQEKRKYDEFFQAQVGGRSSEG